MTRQQARRIMMRYKKQPIDMSQEEWHKINGYPPCKPNWKKRERRWAA